MPQVLPGPGVRGPLGNSARRRARASRASRPPGRLRRSADAESHGQPREVLLRPPAKGSPETGRRTSEACWAVFRAAPLLRWDEKPAYPRLSPAIPPLASQSTRVTTIVPDCRTTQPRRRPRCPGQGHVNEANTPRDVLLSTNYRQPPWRKDKSRRYSPHLLCLITVLSILLASLQLRGLVFHAIFS